MKYPPEKINEGKVCYQDYLNDEMLSLAKVGYSSTQLSVKYGCDRATIFYHCKKNGLKLLNTISRFDIVRIRFDMKYPPEKINEGKVCYQDYLNDEKERNFRAWLKKGLKQ